MAGKEDRLLDMEASADYLGITYVTMRTYEYRRKKNARDGQPKPGDIPAPDATFGRSPAWHESTWDKWMETRPGPGAGGGPKPKAKPTTRGKASAKARKS